MTGAEGESPCDPMLSLRAFYCNDISYEKGHLSTVKGASLTRYHLFSSNACLTDVHVFQALDRGRCVIRKVAAWDGRAPCQRHMKENHVYHDSTLQLSYIKTAP